MGPENGLPAIRPRLPHASTNIYLAFGCTCLALVVYVHFAQFALESLPGMT